MKITPQDGIMGATISDFEFGRASEKDLGDLLEAMYRHKILVLKDQHLSSESPI